MRMGCIHATVSRCRPLLGAACRDIPGEVRRCGRDGCRVAGGGLGGLDEMVTYSFCGLLRFCSLLLLLCLICIHRLISFCLALSLSPSAFLPLFFASPVLFLSSLCLADIALRHLRLPGSPTAPLPPLLNTKPKTQANAAKVLPLPWLAPLHVGKRLPCARAEHKSWKPRVSLPVPPPPKYGGQCFAT